MKQIILTIALALTLGTVSAHEKGGIARSAAGAPVLPVKSAPASRAESLTIDDVTGNYFMQGLMAYAGLMLYDFNKVTIARVEGTDNEVTVSGFYKKDALPVKGTIDIDALTLTIPAGQHLFDEEIYGVNVEYSLYMMDQNDDGLATLTQRPIVFKLLPDFNAMTFQAGLSGMGLYNECIGIGSVEFYTMGFYMLYGVAFRGYNTTGTCESYDGKSTFYPTEMFMESKVEAGNLLVSHFPASFDYFVRFTVDPEAGTVNATNGVTYVQGTDSGGEEYIYVCESKANGAAMLMGRDFSLTGTFTVDGDETSITFPTWGVYNDNLQLMGLYRNTTITLPFDLAAEVAAGIDHVDADAIAPDAPVEMFNLQGVRVTNPAPGSVVIMRQGNSVSKTIVR